MSRLATLLAKSLGSTRRCAAVVRRIIGAPDYDTYLAYMVANHPDAMPLTMREFEASRLNSRYTQPGSRCC